MSGRGSTGKHDAKYEAVRNFWGDPAKTEARLTKWDKQPYPGMTMLQPQRLCRFCDTPLYFARNHEGTLIPLDLKAPVYSVVFEHSDARGTEVVRTSICYVSHWATCPEWKKAKAAQGEPV